MSLVVLLVASLLGGTLPVQKKSPEPPTPLVSERGPATSLRDRILRMRKSAGWVRTRQLVSDFILTVDVNLETLDTDASIGIRTLHSQCAHP